MYFLPSLLETNGHFSDIWKPIATEAPSLPVRVREEDEAYIIEAYIPGIRKEQITVEVKNNLLTISATALENKEVKYLLNDFPTGKISRTLKFATRLSPDTSTGSLQDGILTIKAGKAEHKSTKILID